MLPDTRAPRSRTGRAAALALAGTTLLGSTLFGLAPGTASASSHREAPLIAGDPQHDNTDVYAFVSPDDPSSVTMIANWIPFSEPNGGPNFYPFQAGSKYNINIDSNGDGAPEKVYQWVFKDIDNRAGTFLYNNGVVDSFEDPNLLFKQTYTLTETVSGQVLAQDAPVAPSNVGPASMPDYGALRDGAITDVTGGGKSYAGQADDPFFLDLRVFDLIYGGDLSETGQDTLAGYNVNSVALQLPKDALALGGDATNNPVIGVWSTTEAQPSNLQTGESTGAPVQVSRLGQPLINEVVLSSDLKDTFNSIDPTKDATLPPVVDRVLNPEVPQLLESIYGLPAPTGPRTDLAEVFLTGVTTKLDGSGFYQGTLGAATDAAPIPLDLNSQLLNAGSADPAAFQPSEMLRLNMGIDSPTALNDDGTMSSLDAASPLGVVGGDIQGFPNGRRLADDVVDIELTVLGGVLLGDGQNQQATALASAGGDGVAANDNAFGHSFPYLALPNNQSVNLGGGASAGTMPSGGVETGAGVSSSLSPGVSMIAGIAAIGLVGFGATTLLKGRGATPVALGGGSHRRRD